MQPIPPNTLWYGDNLDVLRKSIATESVDLIYIDPPFNSNRNYNVLFRDEHGKESDAQITAFEDTWRWNESAEALYCDLTTQGPSRVAKHISAMRDVLGASQLFAYVVMMAARLVEFHRVLKPTGSFYLHCDPTASHYLKIVLDAIFGPEQFRNDITWKRTSAHNDPNRYGANTDTILFYSKGRHWTWNPCYTTHNPEYVARFRNSDPDGRRWTDDNLTAKGLAGGGYTYEYKGAVSLWRVPRTTMERLDAEGRLHFTKTGGIRLKRYLDETPGVPLQALWDDIPPLNSQATERLGYPTQKPLALLERIISASSNPGDLVLDGFCGCGTTIAAAEKLGRRWIGIDITYLAVNLQQNRLKDMYPSIRFAVEGVPKNANEARQLATKGGAHGRYQFQWWAASLIGAKPVKSDARGRGKKGSDNGIDAEIFFLDEARGKLKRAVVQVKSGKVERSDIAELRGTVEREQAALGVFITLEKPTTPMQLEAQTAGYYSSPWRKKPYPRIQILTIDDLFNGATVQMPPAYGTFKEAPRVELPQADQPELF